jgi:hypothetical protein
VRPQSGIAGTSGRGFRAIEWVTPVLGVRVNPGYGHRVAANLLVSFAINRALAQCRPGHECSRHRTDSGRAEGDCEWHGPTTREPPDHAGDETCFEHPIYQADGTAPCACSGDTEQPAQADQRRSRMLDQHRTPVYLDPPDSEKRVSRLDVHWL